MRRRRRCWHHVQQPESHSNLVETATTRPADSRLRQATSRFSQTTRQRLHLLKLLARAGTAHPFQGEGCHDVRLRTCRKVVALATAAPFPCTLLLARRDRGRPPQCRLPHIPWSHVHATPRKRNADPRAGAFVDFSGAVTSRRPTHPVVGVSMRMHVLPTCHAANLHHCEALSRRTDEPGRAARKRPPPPDHCT